MDARDLEFITARIPHRPPFLWLDRVLDLTKDFIRAEKELPSDLAVFAGHYPDYPIMPGVLLCEAVFQAGALLLVEQMRQKGREKPGMPVLTRIQGARFKREIRPGDTIVLEATIKERVGPAWFLKGTVRIRNKVAVQVDFSCAVT